MGTDFEHIPAGRYVPPAHLGNCEIDRLQQPQGMQVMRDPVPPADRAAGRPRERTKQQAVLALLRREEGATIAQIMETTGGQSHTVRGFLAGLKRKGIQVDVLERVRHVGPDKEGAKGAYSIYRITG